uniref:Uncharacterized protein n=1 Tax=Tetradesmus obliquus TaxID=3088 RepID=A0A383VS50_TETOB|eukprot:jgi/Sobl393_1/15088/SZX67710.1
MQRIHRSIAAIAALAAICGLLAGPVQACSSLGFEVGDNLAPNFETPVLNDDKTFKRYAVPEVPEVRTHFGDQLTQHQHPAAAAAAAPSNHQVPEVSEVRTHFGDQLSQPPLKFASSTGTTFACVDARGDGAELGTPGGDLAELVSGIMAWHKMEGKPFSKEQAKTMFDAFITKIARPGRPMYLHTDDNRLRRLFVNLTEKGMSPPPSKLPDVGPSNAAEKAMWLEGLTHPDYQGCGHVRLMLNPEFTPYYSLKLSGDKVVDCTNVTEAADCISSKDVAAEVLSLFYK